MTRLILLAALLLGGCATVPGAKPASNDIYKAVGTEPFWSLTIEDRQLVFEEANAPGVRITQPKPRPIIGIAGEIYQTPRINVNIVHVRCSDGMSDRIYPDKVQVRVDDRAFEGCGGQPIPSPEIANTAWTVQSVNGRPTGGGERFQLRFEGDRISGRFGCNSMGGRYTSNGSTLLATGLVMTRMACPDMNFEDAAARILSQPVQMTFQPGDLMTLGNAAGSITLRRHY